MEKTKPEKLIVDSFVYPPNQYLLSAPLDERTASIHFFFFSQRTVFLLLNFCRMLVVQKCIGRPAYTPFFLKDYQKYLSQGMVMTISKH